MLKNFLALLVICMYVVLVMAGIEWFTSDAGFNVHYLEFVVSTRGVALTGTLFTVMTAFIFAQAIAVMRRPRTAPMTNGALIAWAIMPAWKGCALLFALGLSEPNF